MKKTILTLIPWIIVCTSCSTTKPSKNLVISYDLSTGVIEIPDNGFTIKHGGSPKIVVNNVNTSQYTVSVDEQTISTTYETSAESDAARDPAGTGGVIPVVSDNQKIADRAQLDSRAQELIQLLVKYNSANLEYLKGRYTSLTKSTGMSFEHVHAAMQDLDSLFLPLKMDILSDYSKIAKEYPFLLSQLLELGEGDEKAAALAQTLELTHEEFKEINVMDLILTIDELRNRLTPYYFTAIYHAPPVAADEAIYTLTIERKDTTPATHQKKTIPIHVRVAGNWKIDVSSGVIFNLGLIDESYRLDAAGNDSLQLVQNAKRSIFTPTVGILTHVYRKSTTYTNWGISFGLGITDEQRLRYYGGAGIMLGEKQRFVISGGLSAAPQSVLKGQYQAGQKFNASSVPETFTETAYRLGGFFSITYNLSSNSVKTNNNTVSQ